jgi:DNA repair protein RadC
MVLRFRTGAESPEDLYRLLAPFLKGSDREYLLLVFPGASHTEVHVVGEGNDRWVTCSARRLLRTVLVRGRRRFVLAHNRPRTDIPYPSRPDIRAHRRVDLGADLLGLEAVDFVIVGEKGFFSQLGGGSVQVQDPPHAEWEIPPYRVITTCSSHGRRRC